MVTQGRSENPSPAFVAGNHPRGGARAVLDAFCATTQVPGQQLGTPSAYILTDRSPAIADDEAHRHHVTIQEIRANPLRA